MSTVIYCVYHKSYYKRPDTNGFTFFGVNEVYPKKETEDNILEYNLDIYDPLLQKRGYMETSAYLHVYWNKLYKNNKMVGFCQYDMKHNNNYNNLDHNKIYFLNTNVPIVKNGEWSNMMCPHVRDLDFLLNNYNKHFNTKINLSSLENMPLSLWQTNIYPVNIYEKLCSWLEILVKEIYPWCNRAPYEEHFGSVGGYTERAIGLFNAIEVLHGTSFINLNIIHGIGHFEKEQYNTNSFLNYYEKDIYSVIVDKSCECFNVVKNTFKTNQVFIRKVNNISYIHYVNSRGIISEPLMIIDFHNKFKKFKSTNIVHDNLDSYIIFYMKTGNKIELIFNAI
jgi:hypothetical protein